MYIIISLKNKCNQMFWFFFFIIKKSNSLAFLQCIIDDIQKLMCSIHFQMDCFNSKICLFKFCPFFTQPIFFSTLIHKLPSF